MEIPSNTPDVDEGILKNSDLVGLLKAASLTEFRPDNIAEEDEGRLFKSSSLFDLVRSNLVDSDSNNETDKQEKRTNSQNDLLDEIEKQNLNEISDAQVSVGEENPETISEGTLEAIDDAIDQKIHDQHAAGNVEPENSIKIKTKGLIIGLIINDILTDEADGNSLSSSDIDSSFADYFFDVLADEQIDAGFVCNLINSGDKDLYKFARTDFVCPDIQQEYQIVNPYSQKDSDACGDT